MAACKPLMDPNLGQLHAKPGGKREGVLAAWKGPYGSPPGSRDGKLVLVCYCSRTKQLRCIRVPFSGPMSPGRTNTHPAAALAAQSHAWQILHAH